MSTHTLTTNTNVRALPDYDEPPVIETLLSVSFSDLERWSIPHFGLYWNSIRSEYPKFELRPPVLAQIERFGEIPDPSPILELMAQPLVRCWFIHQNDNRLIQVQNDRFIFNWRKVQPDEPYPRFDRAIRREFENQWQGFLSFLDSESIPPPQIEQCEITYINHVPLEGGWQSFSSLVQALSSWPGTADNDFLPVPEDITFNTRYSWPSERGRLHIQLQPAIRNIDGKKVLQLTLTARGKPASPDTEGLLIWFDRGREWIVRGFTDFTSQEMHQIWQRRQ